MTNDKPKQRGGIRNPPGGAPRKNNIKWFCYLDEAIAKRIDEERGKLTRGEFITMLVASHAIDKSNA